MSQNQDLPLQAEPKASVLNPDELTNPGTIPPQRGGGPKTEAGKLVSAQNARKHSFYATKLFRPDEEGNEEHQEFTRILGALHVEYQPVGVLEQMMTERIATEYIRLGRLLAFERSEFRKDFAFHQPAVDKMMRYQATIHRQLGQAMAQLERLQRMRAGHFVPAPLSIDLRVDTSEVEPEALGSVCSDTDRPSGGAAASASVCLLEVTQPEAILGAEPAEGQEEGEECASEDEPAISPETAGDENCGTNSTTSPDETASAVPAASPPS